MTSYGDNTIGGPRTQNKSAYTSLGNLGSNLITGWTLSTGASDAEQSSTSTSATGSNIGSPGRTNVNATTQNFNPCSSVPTGNLKLNLNTAATTNYIDFGASNNASNISLSGVINDPTDPGKTLGLDFTVLNGSTAMPATDFTITASSNNTSVVSNANITVAKSNGAALVTINPSGVGYSTITLTLSSSTISGSATFTINYAASTAAATPANTFFHTGYADASATLALDDDYMVIADDEKNILNVYARNHSGFPVKTFDYSGISGLALNDLNSGAPREIDIESVVKSASPSSPNRSYWMGSYSNQSTGNHNARPNRNRLFALDITGTGANANFSYVGTYNNLRDRLINWGNTYNLGLATSAAAGEDPKLIDGFNIEAIAFAPDNTTMYIGFRAPLLPTNNRVNALIAPIQNFESWFGNGTTSNPSFGAPILLNLAGRGIRDLYRVSDNSYIIIAGDYDDAGAISTKIYQWNGTAANAPVEASINISGLNPESLLPYSGSGAQQFNTLSSGTINSLQMISDNGTANYYNDGTAAKDLSNNAFKKFRSDIVSSSIPVPIVFGSFDVDYLGKGKVAIKWEANNIAPNSKFVVERSINGKDFEAVATVYSEDGKHSYNYTDEVCCRTRFYYKLAEQNTDGGVFYTNIKMVNLSDLKDGLIDINYNNNNNQLSVKSNGSNLNIISVYDMSGKQVLTQKVDSKNTTISLSSLAQGVLIVEASNEETVKHQKIVR